MTVIHPPVKADPRMNWRAWIATGALVPPPDSLADVRRSLPPVAAVFCLGVGFLCGLSALAVVWKP